MSDRWQWAFEHLNAILELRLWFFGEQLAHRTRKKILFPFSFSISFFRLETKNI